MTSRRDVYQRTGGLVRRWIDRRWALWAFLTLNVPLAIGLIVNPASFSFRFGLIVLALAALAVGVTVQRPAVPAAWWLIIAGVAAHALATWTRAVTVQPTGGPALERYAAAVTVSFILLIVGLGLLARLSGRAYLADTLDATLVALTTFLLLSWLVIGQVLPVDRVGIVAQVAFPLCALLLLAMTIRVGLSVRMPTAAVGMLLLAMLLRVGAAVSIFVPALTTGFLQRTALTGFLFTASGILLGAGALHPSLAAARARKELRHDLVSRARIVLFVAMALVALAALAVEVWSARARAAPVTVPLIAASVLLVLIVARLGMTAGMAQRWAVELTRRSDDLAGALRHQEVLQRQLRHQAMHDPLTGLPNRVVLAERLEWVLTRAGGQGRQVLAIVDLDRFKDINDTFGHLVGDALLIDVSHRLLAATPGHGLLARLVGDEFAVLLDGAETDEARRWAEQARMELRKPYRVGNHEIFVDVHVGLLPCGEPRPYPTAAQALRDADLALRAAASSETTDRVAVFSPELLTAQAYFSRLKHGLRRALARDEMTIHYQPIVDMTTGRPVAAEALLRWHPPGTPATPAEFIPVAEQTGMIGQIGAWVLRNACRDAKPWYDAYGLSLAVNVSARQLDDSGFADLVAETLRDTGLPGSALMLEITEGNLVATTSLGEAMSQIERIRAHGVRVAIDDFGTGYSSLSYLTHLPVDIVKIDKSFVHQLAPDRGERRWAFTRAVLHLVGAMGLPAVAEGVETPEQAAALRELSCPLAQGYLFGRPMPAEALARILATGPALAASPPGGDDLAVTGRAGASRYRPAA